MFYSLPKKKENRFILRGGFGYEGENTYKFCVYTYPVTTKYTCILFLK